MVFTLSTIFYLHNNVYSIKKIRRLGRNLRIITIHTRVSSTIRSFHAEFICQKNDVGTGRLGVAFAMRMASSPNRLVHVSAVNWERLSM